MFKIAGFFSYILALFINAFVDLGHKIIIQNTVFKLYDNEEQIILTAIVNALVLLPFILIFTPSSYLANRYPKNLIMRYSAFFAVIITLCITFTYYMGWFYLAFFFTFLLATQSAIYSPAKYAYIKELVGSRFISSANAAVQATTTVAILSGIIFFTTLFELNMPSTFSSAEEILQEMVPLGFILVIASLLEFYLTIKLPNRSRGRDKKAKFNFSKYIKGYYFRKNIKVLTRKRDIFFAVIFLSIFWSISQVLLAIFGAYAKENLHITNTIMVQGVMALAAIGIVFGSISAAKISHYYIHTGLITIGAIGFTAVTLLLPFTTEIVVIAFEFFSFGFFAGLFLVPLNAYIQYNTPRRYLGIVLAANNYVQNIFMFTFLLFTTYIAYMHVDVFYIFICMFVIGVFVVLFALKHYFIMTMWTIVELVLSLRYKFIVHGREHIKDKGTVLYLGNHVSWIDWMIVHLPQRRDVHFVMEREYYNLPILRYIFKKGGAIPISNRSAKSAIQETARLLRNRKAVVLFPEGRITHDEKLAKFHKGFEKVVANVDEGKIVPFYIGGMYGSRLFSRAKTFSVDRSLFRRVVHIYFSEAIDIKSSSEEVFSVVKELEKKYNSFKNRENYAP